MVNRSDDAYEILNDATNGMNSASSLKPTLQLYSEAENVGQYYSNNHNILLIKQYSFDRKVIHPIYEKQVWAIPCLLIAESWDKLEDYFDEVRRVVNKYNSSPWAENSRSYDFLDILNHGPTTENERWKYNCEFTLLLVNWQEEVAT